MKLGRTNRRSWHSNRAVAEQSRAVAASPDVDEYKIELSNQLDNLGEQYVDLGKVAEGLVHYREEISRRRELVAAQPRNREYALNLADSFCKLGGIQLHDGDSRAALEAFAKAREVLESVVAIKPSCQSRLARSSPRRRSRWPSKRR